MRSGQIASLGIPGQATPAAVATYALTASSAAAVAANTGRAGILIVNNSANWVYLGIGATAVLGSGIAIPPYGGSWLSGDAETVTGAINAIAATAVGTLSIQEFS